MTVHAAQRPRVCIRSFEGRTGPISMLSQTADTCVLDKGPLPKLAELKRFESHSFSESADRFNEIANRMVNMGLRLQER